MTQHILRRAAFICFIVCGGAFLTATAQNQSPGPEQKPAADEVLRINTELVQTDVTVFDKKGRLVNQLTADQFQLAIDGKPQPISFFERVTFDSNAPNAGAPGAAAGTQSRPAVRGRSVLFFVDDLHLAPDSLARTRTAMLDFVNHGMAPHDQVAITSTSGQVGFLQQFTDNKSVLQLAVARLSYRGSTNSDTDSPPMSEYMALKIQQGDESAISYYVQELLKQNCFRVNGEFQCTISPQSARVQVLVRARRISTLSSPEIRNTLVTLEGLMRTAAQLPGRKLLFLISDGFYLNDRQTGSMDRIKKIADAAGRAGVVIYTLDARGLIAALPDATTSGLPDAEGLTTSARAGEIAASQDGLNALARDTGGLPFRNTNRPMGEWVNQVLAENSTYYVIAWRPESEEQKRRRFNKLQVSIKDRPDLTVRIRQGYFRTTPLPMLSVKGKADKDATPRENDMRVVVDTVVPQREIKADLTLSLVQKPGIGNRVLATVEIDRSALAFDMFDGRLSADVDIGGIFYDDKGKPKSSFVGRLRILASEGASAAGGPAVYRFQSWLPAGLYQVRVGLRDVRSGKTGNAAQWITIPRL
jgi:VWFA-related protein